MAIKKDKKRRETMHERYIKECLVEIEDFADCHGEERIFEVCKNIRRALKGLVAVITVVTHENEKC